MKGQFFVAQLPILLEQCTAQNRLHAHPAPPRCLGGVPQVLSHPIQALRVRVQPARHGSQLAPDFMFGELIEYTGLECAFCAHVRSGVLCFLYANQ
jgi:hypothetical protein